MKRIILLSITIILFTACKKVPFDYRNKYIGEYEFTSIVSGFPLNCCFDNSACCENYKVLTYRGVISLGSEGNQIIIQYINEQDYLFKDLLWINGSYYSNTDKYGKLKTKVNEDGIIDKLGTFYKDGNVEFNITINSITSVDSVLFSASHKVIGKKIN